MERGRDEMMGNKWIEGGGWVHEWMKEQIGKWEDESQVNKWMNKVLANRLHALANYI